MLGIVGSTSLIECSVNRDYYAEQGYYLIIAGVSQDCFTSPNFSAVNMGPYYSSLGGAQAALRAGAEGTIVVASPNAAGLRPDQQRRRRVRRGERPRGREHPRGPAVRRPGRVRPAPRPGGRRGRRRRARLHRPNVLPLLQAIEQQGLIDSVIWASSTPPNDPSVAEALGPAWNDKFLINAEFNVLDSGEPDQNHMNEVREQYAPDVNQLELRPDGLPRRAHRHRRPARHRGRDHQGERQRGVPQRHQLHQRHLVQAVVLRQRHRLERVQQTSTSPSPRRTATWCSSRTASTSPSCRATRSPRSAPAEQELGLNVAAAEARPGADADVRRAQAVPRPRPGAGRRVRHVGRRPRRPVPSDGGAQPRLRGDRGDRAP